jgi:hypothetical protein
MVQNLVGDKTDKKEAARLPLAEGQAAIAQQGASPRYDAGSIMGLVSSLRSPGEANTAFDPNKPIGGENVPYKGTSGVGGVFSRFFGNRANEMNVEAQQLEAAQMQDKALRDEERTAKREDLAEEIRLRTEAERGLKKEDREFTASQAEAARQFQAAENSLDRVMRSTEGGLDRNLRISLATADRDAAANRLDKELGFRASEGAADRAFRSSEGAAERGFRAGESKADREARLAEGEANRALTAAHYNLVREDNAADRNLRASEGAAGRELQREGQRAAIQYKQSPRFERLGENVYTNEKGEVFEYSPGMPDLKTGKQMPGGFRKVPTPGVMAPSKIGGGGNMQVDRATGKPLGAVDQLPPGGGVMRPGGAAATMGAAQPSAEPRYATLGDRLLTLPGMGAIVDMPRIMNPERTARLAESRSLQDAENRERIRRMQQDAGQDLGPSMF